MAARQQIHEKGFPPLSDGRELDHDSFSLFFFGFFFSPPWRGAPEDCIVSPLPS